MNFTRGSLIELSNGSLRRVEDLRTEDFVLSAEKSVDLQLADSTVVKILPASNNFVMITFSYDNNRSKVSESKRDWKLI
jgi:ataxin 1/1L